MNFINISMLEAVILYFYTLKTVENRKVFLCFQGLNNCNFREKWI